jgi:hypothetical protein
MPPTARDATVAQLISDARRAHPLLPSAIALLAMSAEALGARPEVLETLIWLSHRLSNTPFQAGRDPLNALTRYLRAWPAMVPVYHETVTAWCRSGTLSPGTAVLGQASYLFGVGESVAPGTLVAHASAWVSLLEVLTDHAAAVVAEALLPWVAPFTDLHRVRVARAYLTPQIPASGYDAGRLAGDAAVWRDAECRRLLLGFAAHNGPLAECLLPMLRDDLPAARSLVLAWVGRWAPVPVFPTLMRLVATFPVASITDADLVTLCAHPSRAVREDVHALLAALPRRPAVG